MTTPEPTFDQFDQLTKAIRAIAHGDSDGPSGLEIVAMALQGGDDQSVAGALTASADRIAESLNNVAIAINTLAQAVQGNAA